MFVRTGNNKQSSNMVLISYLILFIGTIGLNLIRFEPGVYLLITGGDDVWANLFLKAIWLILLFWLGAYGLYQARFNKKYPNNHDHVIKRVNLYFILFVCALVGYFSTVYFNWLTAALVINLVSLGLSYKIRATIGHRSNLNDAEKKYISLPFSLALVWQLVLFYENIVAWQKEQLILWSPSQTEILLGLGFGIIIWWAFRLREATIVGVFLLYLVERLYWAIQLKEGLFQRYLIVGLLFVGVLYLAYSSFWKRSKQRSRNKKH